MPEFTSGDVRVHTYADGTSDYIRVGHPHPDGSASVWVMTCDAQGEHLQQGRYLQAATIAHRYAPAPTPIERYTH